MLTGEDENAGTQAVGPADVSMDLAAHRVLVVDDEPEVRNVVALLFGSMGAEVSTAASGREALALICAGADVTLLVSDVRMPDMDGHALLRAVREVR